MAQISGSTNNGTSACVGTCTSTGYGVDGTSTSGDGVKGGSANSAKSGVWGYSSGGGYGVSGSTGGGWPKAGVWGSSSGTGPGVYATNSGMGAAVYAVSNQSNCAVSAIGYCGAMAAIMINQMAIGGLGIYSAAEPSAGGNTSAGIVAAINGTPYAGDFAGYFVGDAFVTGTLTKAAGSFLIDHPLDPENKTLRHSFVESSEMKNIYDGVVTADAKGEATVQLPAWFEPINCDFRYQLTAIGAAAPNLHVAQEIKGGSFRIAGAPGGSKVSWQVTGVRQDAYAKAHPMPVEEDKRPNEKGTYLHPKEHGVSEDKRLANKKFPQLVNAKQNLYLDQEAPREYPGAAAVVKPTP